MTLQVDAAEASAPPTHVGGAQLQSISEEQTAQADTMTIAQVTTYSTSSTSMRMPSMRSSFGANPMMQATLPREAGDDPLASPVGFKPEPIDEDEPTPAPQVEEKPAPAPAPTTRSFLPSFARRRAAPAPAAPAPAAAADTAKQPPSLRRGTSAPLSASLLVSKVTPMLKRVVSGSVKTPAPPPAPTRAEHQDEDNIMDEQQHDLLLQMMQVPMKRRQSQVPLMSFGHEQPDW
ncbi:hypothetical protein Poli38472_002974 [Pythium oligandrum]|uniref:Uncharacterized protein n=1 Tax=Pythium oligandrum TaxID=41045 RepID=A0A8K1C5X6_PYTOL|nr:hypothetical protein Poli38472_002974 [Pythium oligandrum]|eukprot:TMW57049.1 hypothetical protein Poli38472_002974 [Pythium oligandrum]